MKRFYAAPIVFVVGACVLFLTGWAFTFQGGLVLMACGLVETLLSARSLWQAGCRGDDKRFSGSAALQEAGYAITAAGLGCLLLQYPNAALPFVCFSAAALFLAQLVLSLSGVVIATSRAGYRLALFCLAGVPMTLGFAGLWQLCQGALSLPMAEAAAWVKPLLAVLFAVLGLTWGLRLGACGMYYRAVSADAEREKPPFRLAEAMAPVADFVLGLFPILLVAQAEQLLLSARLPFPVGDFMGLIWGGTGRYAIYSPLIVAVLFFMLLAVLDAVSGKRRAES
ncbi:MAG: hypothetical protein VZQ81_06675 [Succiniclasticum sp.]|jgi:hydrogenase-4 component B|nr:hypothetical protein [Succiniclasticum sp.]MEE3479688.1 hypothetical protein [Succiniclasticum sp.]